MRCRRAGGRIHIRRPTKRARGRRAASTSHCTRNNVVHRVWYRMRPVNDKCCTRAMLSAKITAPGDSPSTCPHQPAEPRVETLAGETLPGLGCDAVGVGNC